VLRQRMMLRQTFFTPNRIAHVAAVTARQTNRRHRPQAGCGWPLSPVDDPSSDRSYEECSRRLRGAWCVVRGVRSGSRVRWSRRAMPDRLRAIDLVDRPRPPIPAHPDNLPNFDRGMSQKHDRSERPYQPKLLTFWIDE
jgi:hypothetical protein